MINVVILENTLPPFDFTWAIRMSFCCLFNYVLKLTDFSSAAKLLDFGVFFFTALIFTVFGDFG